MDHVCSVVDRKTDTATEVDSDYKKFELLIGFRVSEIKGPLFTTDATGLFDAYLAGIPGESKNTANAIVEPTEPGRRQKPMLLDARQQFFSTQVLDSIIRAIVAEGSSRSSEA